MKDQTAKPNDAPPVRHQLDAGPCPKCGGTGELQTSRGWFDCPDCDATGIKARIIKTAHAGGVA